jgi:integrase
MAPRTLHRLNAIKVRSLKASGLHEDGGGLRLVVSDTGSKRWVMRISVNGNRHQFGLGSYPSVSLERARERAAEIRRARSEGRNVVAERRGGRRGAITFREAFERYFRSKEPTLSNAKHRAQWRTTMATYVFPIIGQRAVADVQPEEVLKIVMPIWRTKPETAGRVLQRIDAVLHFAIANNWRERASACIGARQVLGSRRKSTDRHYRFLPYPEAPGLMARLRAMNPSPARLCLQWTILTACRSGEARLARWNEINEETSTWIVPPERMKARRAHAVPLSPECMDVLSKARLSGRGSELIFAGAKRNRPLSDMALTKLLRDMGLAERATVHGFRSTFKVWAAEVAKVRDEVSEAALAHVIPNKVRAAYLRTDFLEERRKLMADWARYVGWQHELPSEVAA